MRICRNQTLQNSRILRQTQLTVNVSHMYNKILKDYSKFDGRNRDYQKSSCGYKKEPKKDSPGDAVVNTTLPLQAVKVQSLERELRSHMLHGTIKKRK